MTTPIWLFGYGSIMWKTGFAFEESRLGFIRNRSRRFWQGSTDHRGTPEQPGRVVTLIEAPGACCWGMSYRLPESEAAEILKDLDHREKGGYIRENVNIEFDGHPDCQGLTYYAGSKNPNFLGPADLVEIAHQIVASKGPSGPNKEYILQLNQTLEAHGIVDEHVLELASHVQQISSRVET